jgi:hypothetical protein
MNAIRLVVPSSSDPKDWFDFVERSREIDETADYLIVDFNTVSFLGSDDFVILACIIEGFHIKGCKITFSGGSPNFNNHLNNIKFKSYWSEGFDREKFTLSRNETTLCLWKISEEMTYSYSAYAKKYFQRFAEDKDLVPLASNIDEVFNNIFDHSESPVTGYIITQYYPRNRKISFAVCDFGIGIPTSVNRNRIQGHKNAITDDLALHLSLEQGFSVKSTPRNRGFGLNNILALTEACTGQLEIVSNSVYLGKKSGELLSIGIVNYNFEGTLIKVELKLNEFIERDLSEEIHEF